MAVAHQLQASDSIHRHSGETARRQTGSVTTQIFAYVISLKEGSLGEAEKPAQIDGPSVRYRVWI
ncbi:MAG: hypothetical protein ACM3UZ_16585, partial [Acidobacteriota bacterium]